MSVRICRNVVGNGGNEGGGLRYRVGKGGIAEGG